jgi:hypothetical protein
VASPLAAILLSRQPLQPDGSTPWVEQCIQAVRWIGSRGFTLLTSTGLSTWELLSVIASREGVAQRLIIPVGTGEDTDRCLEQARENLELDATTRIVALPAEAESGSGRAGHLQSRDRRVAAEADLLVPIALRPGGGMERLLATQAAGKQVEAGFRIPITRPKAGIGYHVDQSRITAALRGIREDYVIHWTRTSNGPWPSESPACYYRAILDSSAYPRSAFATLRNILHSGIIFGSHRHMPRGVSAVCFSAAPPVRFAPLMRWRARYRQMSFEPYGIGIERSCAVASGIRPVLYHDPKHPPAGAERWLWQSRGTKGNWEPEAEWRSRGDFDLGSIPNEKIIAFCYRQQEAKEIEREFGLRAVGFVEE